MKIVLISDTHGQHEDFKLPNGDMLVHAGDVSKRGTNKEIDNFLDWFSQKDFKYKIFIAGNHDFFFESISNKELLDLIPDDVIYLNDSGVEIEGIKIWGSPIQPEFYDWAFNRTRGDAIQKHWDMIPKDTDILITHGPPLGILDTTLYGKNVGCKNLLDTVLETKVKIHVFGHIHEAYGIIKTKRTEFINASSLDHNYSLINEPIVLDYL